LFENADRFRAFFPLDLIFEIKWKIDSECNIPSHIINTKVTIGGCSIEFEIF
jgi:hypothetical protein